MPIGKIENLALGVDESTGREVLRQHIGRDRSRFLADRRCSKALGKPVERGGERHPDA
jgi:hypothetical protein